MKTIRLNDNLIINIENIYSLQCIIDSSKKDAWELAVNNALLSDNFKDYVKKNISKDNLSIDDVNKISDIIESQIGECPQPEYQYIVTLNSGIKVDIDKRIYTILNNELNKYRIDL